MSENPSNAGPKSSTFTIRVELVFEDDTTASASERSQTGKRAEGGFKPGVKVELEGIGKKDASLAKDMTAAVCDALKKLRKQANLKKIERVIITQTVNP